MSVDSLKKLYSIAWVDEKHNPNTFGPPAFDESFSTYTWRVFKRGFSWGKKITISHKIGFMLTTVVMVQYQYVMFLMKGMAGRSPSVLLMQPLVYGVLVGTGFGFYENICYP